MSDRNKYSIDVDGLDIDWASQRTKINKRLEEAEPVGRHTVMRWALASAVVAVIASAIISWPFFKARFESPDDQIWYQAEVEEAVDTDDYIPYGLYVMNRLNVGEDDFETTVNFIIPSVDGEEAL